MRRTTTLAILAISAAGVSGASAQATAGAGAAATTLRLKADPGGENRFTKERLRASPGRITIRFRNPGTSGRPHAVAIEGRGVEKESAVARPGERVSLRARLKRGRYTFYCPVGSHRADGMKGRLVVR